MGLEQSLAGNRSHRNFAGLTLINPKWDFLARPVVVEVACDHRHCGRIRESEQSKYLAPVRGFIPVHRQGGTLSKNPPKSFVSTAATAPPKPPTLMNTRRWPRHPLDIPIRVIVQNSDRTKLYDGRGNELNEGGMAVAAGAELHIGGEVAVEFTPPFSSIPIRVRAIVRNRAGYRYGVEFLTQHAEETENVTHLRSLLQTLSKMSKD